MLLQDGLEVGRGDRSSGKGKREGLTRVSDEDELELSREGRREELGEDGLADSTEAEECDRDGTGNDSGGHYGGVERKCGVYMSKMAFPSSKEVFRLNEKILRHQFLSSSLSPSLLAYYSPYHDEAMRPKIPIQSILSPVNRHIATRHIASCARLHRQRQLDYLAPFRRPANPPYSPLNDKLRNVLQTHGRPAASPEGNAAYETASTAPVATSLQEVPRREDEEASRLVDPVPAMKDASGAKEEQSKEKTKARNKEMIVQGIVVPPKPTPPGEEGWRNSQNDLAWLC